MKNNITVRKTCRRGRKMKMKNRNVSPSVIKRLPRYFRYLNELNLSGVTRISSKELSEKMHITASQIRQDLNCFGGFGQQGYGYNIETLLSEIKHLLGADRHINAIIVGLGNMGLALANNMKFERRGVFIVGLFDTDEKKIGLSVKGNTVLSADKLNEFCREHKPDIAILTVPRDAVVNTAHRLYGLGVRGFWNFSNVELDVPGAQVENVHLGDSLMHLCYNLVNGDNESDE